MKSKLLIAATCLCLLTAGCRFNINLNGLDKLAGKKVEETISKSFPLPAGGEIRVATISGDIHFLPATGTTVTVQAVKSARAATEKDARALLRNLKMDAVSTGGALTIRTIYPRWANNTGGDIDYTIRAPLGTRVTAQTTSGDISLEGAGNNTSAGSVSGDIRITAAQDALKVHSVSGDISLTDCSGDTDARTTSGDLGYETTKSNARALRFSSTSGDVSVKLPTGTPLSLTASTVSGDIDNALKSTSGEGSRAVRFTRGAGGPAVSVNTVSGDITLRE